MSKQALFIAEHNLGSVWLLAAARGGKRGKKVMKQKWILHASVRRRSTATTVSPAANDFQLYRLLSVK